MKTLLSAALFAAVTLMFSPAAQASEVVGKLDYLIVRDGDGLIYFEVSGARSAKPACAATGNYFMIRDENSATGKRTYALLLSALLTGRTVRVWGADTCARWGNGEDVHAVQLMPQ